MITVLFKALYGIVKLMKSKPHLSVLKWEWNADNQMWVYVL